MTRRTALWLLLAIIIIGTSLRLYHLTDRSLWFDEAFSWRLIQFPLPEMLIRAAADVHPPLYYLLLKTWRLVFASSLLSLRMFSVTWATLTIAAAYLFTSYAARTRAAGLFAAFLLALSGFQIQYAWEARMYTLGTALVLFSSYLLLKAIRQAKLGWWISYAVVTVAFAYVHYFAFFSIAAQGVFVVGYLIARTRGRLGELIQWRQTWFAFIAAIVMIIIYLPWVPTFIKQNAQVQQSYWIPPIGGWSIPDTLYRMFAPTALVPRHIGLGWIALAVLPITATIIGWLILVAARRSSIPRDARSLVMLSGFIPFLLAIAISFLGQSLYQDRFFVFAQPFIVIGLAMLVINLRSSRLRRAIITLALFGFAAAHFTYWQELDIPNKPGASAATRFILEERTPAEPIIVSSPFIFFAAEYYAAQEYGYEAQPKLYSATGELSHFAGGPILTSQDTVTPSYLNNPGLSSVWVMDTTGFGESPLKPGSNWRAQLRQSFPEVFSYQGDVIVTHYVRNE